MDSSSSSLEAWFFSMTSNSSSFSGPATSFAFGHHLPSCSASVDIRNLKNAETKQTVPKKTTIAVVITALRKAVLVTPEFLFFLITSGSWVAGAQTPSMQIRPPPQRSAPSTHSSPELSEVAESRIWRPLRGCTGRYCARTKTFAHDSFSQ